MKINSSIALLLICLGALILRLALLTFIQHPGIGDPNHYYNLGIRLIEGHGFTIDYVWHFNHLHDSIVHPDDHWLPLTAVLAAGGMSLFGQNTTGALVAFVVIGAALCVVGYTAARQFGCGEIGSLFVAAAVGVLPEFVLNSLRTDTTIPNALFACGSILLFTRGLQTGRTLPFILSGFLGGLAYLTRNDAILLLPALAVTLVVYARRGSLRRWYYAALMPLAMLLVVSPWLIRNAQVLGYVTPRETQYMYFFTDQRDHYAYQREFSLETMLAQQTPAQLVGKRLFEMAAAAKVMYTSLDIFLPVAVIGGLILAVRDRQCLLVLTPTLIFLLGAFVFYTVFVPYKAQSGSFKKAYLTLVPLLLPLAGYALERAITDRRLQIGTATLAVALMGANAVELVRADTQFTARYLNYARAVVEKAKTLPDTNADGEIILMVQDPFMMRYLGLRGVMIPMESRDKVLDAARHYGVDYMMMPPDRPSLDPLYTGVESDPRFIHVADISGTDVALYRLDYDATG